MMRRNLFLGTSILLLTVLAVSGCSLKRQPPERRYFVLDVKPIGKFRIPGEGVLLSVQPLTVSPRYESREFVYRKSDGTYESDFYNQFFISPVQELTNGTRAWLAAPGATSEFLGSGSAVRSTHSIAGNVISLYGDYSDPNAPRAVLEIQYALISRKEAELVIRFQKRYDQSVAMESSTPDALAKAWTAAFTNILGEFAADLEKADFSLPEEDS